MTMEQIENNFSHHKPKNDQAERYETLRNEAKKLAYCIQNLSVDSREKSLAFTKLDECVMWANAGIARNE